MQKETKQMGLFFAMFLTLANLTFMTVGGMRIFKLTCITSLETVQDFLIKLDIKTTNASIGNKHFFTK